MFSRFFIDRPIFAAVLSIVITLAGPRLGTLPLAHAEITPPSISSLYPGPRKVVAEAVAAPIEQQVSGFGMLYMSSNSSNDGSA